MVYFIDITLTNRVCALWIHYHEIKRFPNLQIKYGLKPPFSPEAALLSLSFIRGDTLVVRVHQSTTAPLVCKYQHCHQQVQIRKHLFALCIDHVYPPELHEICLWLTDHVFNSPLSMLYLSSISPRWYLFVYSKKMKRKWRHICVFDAYSVRGSRKQLRAK